MKAYLDIETSFRGTITVVGLYRPDVGAMQWVGDRIRLDALLDALEGVHTLAHYNGNRFDLPVLSRHLRFDFRQRFRSEDLMYHCWRRGLRGGLKRVETALAIARTTVGVDGLEAMRLWERHLRGDETALERLLAYNLEDVRNLVLLEHRLCGLPGDPVLHPDVTIVR